MNIVDLGWTKEAWKRDVIRNNETAIARVQVCGVNNIMDLLRGFVGKGWFDSNAEARRMLDQGAVRLNDRKLKFNDKIELKQGDDISMGNLKLKIEIWGKRQF